MAVPPFGLLNLRKPPGVTSRWVVDRVQRLVKPAKVGHAGTLDPLASGVLVVAVGPATRLVEYVQEMRKAYRASFLLGRSSTTEDVDGQVTELAAAEPPRRELLERAALELTGETQQRPPAFSALRVAGRRAYDLARAGSAVELAPRTIHVDRLEILHYDYPELVLDVVCSGGTYVRSLGRDLAERAGSAAVMSALERTAIGHFQIADAVDPQALTRDNLAEHLLSAREAVRGQMPELTVAPEEVQRIVRGQAIGRPYTADRCAAVDAAGRLVAILVRQADTLRVEKCLAGG